MYRKALGRSLGCDTLIQSNVTNRRGSVTDNRICQALTYREGAKPVSVYNRLVDEDVRTTISGHNEAKSLRSVEPFHSTGGFASYLIREKTDGDGELDIDRLKGASAEDGRGAENGRGAAEREVGNGAEHGAFWNNWDDLRKLFVDKK